MYLIVRFLPFELYFLKMLLVLQILKGNTMISFVYMIAQVNKFVGDLCWGF